MKIKWLFIILIGTPQIYCDNNLENIAIIGGGAAGLAAAKYSARAKLKPLIIEETELGGQFNERNIISNWPAVPAMPGRDIAKLMINQAKELGTRFIFAQVDKIYKKGKIFEIALKSEKPIFAKAVIITSGAKPEELGIPGEKEYLGKGVAVCAICDRQLYKNKKVVIIGGDYSALRETDIIAKYTDKITIINKKDDF